MILAARALGLNCGPMSGFDNAKVDEEFFAAGKPCFGCDQEFFPEGARQVEFPLQTSGTVTQVRCSLGFRVCRSTRRVPSYELSGQAGGDPMPNRMRRASGWSAWISSGRHEPVKS